jgi:aspartyl aminopeptidase
MKFFFMRLEKYIAVRPTAAMTDVIGKIIVEVISILGIATKEIGQERFSMHSFDDISPKLDVSRREIRQEAVWNTSS